MPNTDANAYAFRLCRNCFFAFVIAIVVLWIAWRVLSHRAQRIWNVRRPALLTAVGHIRPVQNALEAYRTDFDAYPAKLKHLIPDYTAAIPTPGPPFVREWRYERGPLPEEDPGTYDLFILVPDKYTPWPVGGISLGDTFSYRSDGVYPRYAHGGYLEPVGNWGYYHE